jgi:hypothetical protein
MRLTLIAALTLALAGTAHARTYHYACQSGDDRYALTVNTDRSVVTMAAQQPPHSRKTLRILKVSADCGKYGWALSEGATFCTATQGVGTLEWKGQEFECSQADTD